MGSHNASVHQIILRQHRRRKVVVAAGRAPRHGGQSLNWFIAGGVSVTRGPRKVRLLSSRGLISFFSGKIVGICLNRSSEGWFEFVWLGSSSKFDRSGYLKLLFRALAQRNFQCTVFGQATTGMRGEFTLRFTHTEKYQFCSDFSVFQWYSNGLLGLLFAKSATLPQ